MNRTAMQNHLKWLKFHFKDIGKLDYESVVAQIEMHIDEDERQQIESAFVEGKVAALRIIEGNEEEVLAEQYYNQTYNV